MPEKLQKALAEYSAVTNEEKDLEILFGEVLRAYADYSDVLVAYKSTKFMANLYRDIKTLLQKVKLLLLAELDGLSVYSERVFTIFKFLVIVL